MVENREEKVGYLQKISTYVLRYKVGDRRDSKHAGISEDVLKDFVFSDSSNA